MFMTRFAVGEQVLVRYGKHQGKKATIIKTQLAEIYKVKVEDGWVVFYSGKGLEKQSVQPILT
jgi:ribosomal protein L24